MFQNFLAKQPISLQWVVGEKSFRKSGPLGRFSSSGYWEKSHQAIHSMGLTAQVFLVNGDGR